MSLKNWKIMLYITETYEHIFKYSHQEDMQQSYLQKQLLDLIYGMYIVQAKIYVGKSETSFNIMLNNHPNDVYKVNNPKEDQHFKLPGHNFNQYAIFNLTEQLNKNELGKEPLSCRLMKRDDFWIHKLKNLQSHGFNTALTFSNF